MHVHAVGRGAGARVEPGCRRDGSQRSCPHSRRALTPVIVKGNCARRPAWKGRVFGISTGSVFKLPGRLPRLSFAAQLELEHLINCTDLA